ncbi:hypothetical protein [Kiloniella sp.]|uniref:hypothetical protein n=1 Tax=Kiloniella sp. TaxID=1938587 RepID=UPI003B018E76
MKIKPEDYEILKNFIEKAINCNPNVEAYYFSNFYQPREFREAMLYASKIRITDGLEEGDLHLYAYLNDDHIDTALRSIFRENGFTWAAMKKDDRTPGELRPIKDII